jgi:hypothetical protein
MAEIHPRSPGRLQQAAKVADSKSARGYRIDGFGAFIPPMKQRSEKR